MSNKIKNLLIVLGCLALVALVVVFGLIQKNHKNSTEDSTSSTITSTIVTSDSSVEAVPKKQVIVKIVFADASVETKTLSTDAANLRTALEEENLIEGSESDFGLLVTKVAGIEANSSNKEWWCFTKGGEMLMTGVDDTLIKDGDKFEITLTVGY